MKKILNTTILAIICLLVSCTSEPDKLVGKWAGENITGHAVEITFKENGEFIFNDSGNIAKGNYEVKYSKDPIWLDLHFSSNNEADSAQNFRTVMCVMKFNTDDQIVIKAPENPQIREGLVSYSPKDPSSILLNKISEVAE